MAIGVLIKHLAKDGVDAKTLLPHIIELRALAVRQPGYISGETFFHLDRIEECLVISRWTSLENWQRWTKDSRRIELHQNITEYLGTKIEHNIYGVGLW
ncbi:MAG: antibiotic biosynthesis monooxygenase [Desulfobacterales bacterium]|nr:antibiotic biosynthesis monooxygenase [Desulfobacterales bacterium]